MSLLQAALDTAHAHVVEHGWHVMQVLHTRTAPGWAYTVGLTRTHRHPELVVMGLPIPTGARVLNAIGALVAGGATFEEGARFDDGRGNYPLVFKEVPRILFDHQVALALQFYAGPHFRLLQVVWPDAASVFPWEPGWSPKPRQDLLYLPPQPRRAAHTRRILRT